MCYCSNIDTVSILLFYMFLTPTLWIIQIKKKNHFVYLAYLYKVPNSLSPLFGQIELSTLYYRKAENGEY